MFLRVSLDSSLSLALYMSDPPSPAPCVLGISLNHPCWSLCNGSSLYPPFSTSTTCACTNLFHRRGCTNEEGGDSFSAPRQSPHDDFSIHGLHHTHTRTDLLTLMPSTATLAPMGIEGAQGLAQEPVSSRHRGGGLCDRRKRTGRGAGWWCRWQKKWEIEGKNNSNSVTDKWIKEVEILI
jgi:hypothetical protein